jgi:Protein of unknown function (DUF3352)
MRWRGSRSSSTSSSASGATAPPDPRRRLALLIAAAAVAVAAVVVLVLALTGSSGSGARDDLARLAPPDALLWVAADTSAGNADVVRGERLAGRFPAVRGVPARLAAGLGLSGLDPRRDVRPWLGDAAGLALVPEGSSTAPLVIADVRDRAAARAALQRLGARAAGRADGAALLTTRRGLVALTDSRLIAGPPAAVRAAAARAAGRGAGLDGVAAYARAKEQAGDGQVAFYAPTSGVARLLGSSSPLVRAGAAILSAPGDEAVAGVGETLDGGMRIHAHILRRDGTPAPAAVAPTLLGRVPSDAAAAVLLPGGAALGALADRLGGAALLDAVRGALAAESSLDLDRYVLGPLRESLLSVRAFNDVPVITLVARTRDPSATREALARAQGPLAQRLTGGAQSAFRTLAGGAFTLPVTPALQPSYAVGGNTLVATTAQPGLDEARVAPRGIVQAEALRAVRGDGDGSVQALGYLDLRQLIGLGERTGLATGSGFQAVRGDLGPVLSAAGVATQDPDHPTDTDAELYLQIP